MALSISRNNLKMGDVNKFLCKPYDDTLADLSKLRKQGDRAILAMGIGWMFLHHWFESRTEGEMNGASDGIFPFRNVPDKPYNPKRDAFMTSSRCKEGSCIARLMA